MLSKWAAFRDQQRCFFTVQQYNRMDDQTRDVEWPLAVRRCLTPSRTGDEAQRAIFLFGDSHAAQSSLPMMAAFNGAASVVWAAAAFNCGFLPDTAIEVVTVKDQEDPDVRRKLCQVFNREVKRALIDFVQPCDIVVLQMHGWSVTDDATYDGKYVFDGDGGNSPNGLRAAVFDNIRILNRQMTGKGASMVLMGDIHTIPYEGPLCARSAAAASQCEISRADVRTQTAVERSFYTSLANEDPTNRTFYMPLDHLLCDLSGSHPGRECGALVPGTHTLAFIDTNHLNSAGALYLWPFICDFFEKHRLLGYPF